MDHHAAHNYLDRDEGEIGPRPGVPAPPKPRAPLPGSRRGPKVKSITKVVSFRQNQFLDFTDYDDKVSEAMENIRIINFSRTITPIEIGILLCTTIVYEELPTGAVRG